MLCSSAGSLPADGSFSSNQPSNWSGDRNTVIQPLGDVCISDTVVHVYSGADTRGVCHSLTSVLKLGFSLARAADSISCSTRGVSVVSVVQQFRHDIAAALNWDCR